RGARPAGSKEKGGGGESREFKSPGQITGAASAVHRPAPGSGGDAVRTGAARKKQRGARQGPRASCWSIAGAAPASDSRQLNSFDLDWQASRLSAARTHERPPAHHRSARTRGACTGLRLPAARPRRRSQEAVPRGEDFSRELRNGTPTDEQAGCQPLALERSLRNCALEREVYREHGGASKRGRKILQAAIQNVPVFGVAELLHRMAHTQPLIP